MPRKANSELLVRFLYIPRTRPVAYGISAADLTCSLVEELICTWSLAKTKKKMERSNSRIYLQSVWNMIDALASPCDTSMTNSFPKIQRNITSKRRNGLARRRFSRFSFACGFWSHQKHWLSWALQQCWQTEWCQSRVSVRALQVFYFCLIHLDDFRTSKTKTRGKKKKI